MENWELRKKKTKKKKIPKTEFGYAFKSLQPRKNPEQSNCRIKWKWKLADSLSVYSRKHQRKRQWKYILRTLGTFFTGTHDRIYTEPIFPRDITASSDLWTWNRWRMLHAAKVIRAENKKHLFDVQTWRGWDVYRGACVMFQREPTIGNIAYTMDPQMLR